MTRDVACRRHLCYKTPECAPFILQLFLRLTISSSQGAPASLAFLPPLSPPSERANGRGAAASTSPAVPTTKAASSSSFAQALGVSVKGARTKSGGTDGGGGERDDESSAGRRVDLVPAVEERESYSSKVRGGKAIVGIG